MADTTPKSYSADPTLYLYTSLTAGSSHIITATSRLETILKANKIPFRALDVATDEKARMLWGRRSKDKKLPGLVKYGSIVGDLEEIEEWNEYGELKQQIGSTPVAAPTPTASAAATPSKPPAPSISAPGADSPVPSPLSKQTTEEVVPSSRSAAKKQETPLTIAMRQAGAEAAKKAGEKKGPKYTAPSSAKDLGAGEVPMPAIETKMAKPVEEPGVSVETTAVKVPEKLAEEGAKRTSVDKIAEEGAKRTSVDKIAEEGARRSSMDQVTGLDGISEQEHVGLSKEAAMLEARRASSMTKMISPLSEENAATSSTENGASNFEPSPRTHRGSSVSMAPKEEIEAIEKWNAIPEELEDTGEANTKAGAQGMKTPSTSTPDDAGKLDKPADAMMKDLTATDEGEVAATEGTRPQEQDAKDAEGAGASVGD